MSVGFNDMVPKGLLEKCDPQLDAFDVHILQKKEHDLVAHGSLSVEAIDAHVTKVPQEMSDAQATARMICQLHGIPIETRKLGPEIVITVGTDIWPRSFHGWFRLPWREMGSSDSTFHTADWETVLQVLKTYKAP